MMLDYDKILSSRVMDIKPSGIRKFFDILQDMEDVISLGVGEPDFITPWHIRDAGIYSLEKGFTKYTSNAGMMSLRKEISSYLDRRFALKYDPETQILVTVGGSEAIDLSLRVLIEPGDEVIIPTPSFVCYSPLTTIAGGVPVFVETKAENQFKLTAEELKGAITPKTKAVILPYPCNPTGGIMEKVDLVGIARVLEGTDIIIISDEIYAELNLWTEAFFSGKSGGAISQNDCYKRVFKGLCNDRLEAWICDGDGAFDSTDDKASPVRDYVLAYNQPVCGDRGHEIRDKDIEQMRSEYDIRRRYLVDGVRTMGLECFEPKGAFYIFPCIKSTGMSSDEFCERFLIEEKVAAISGGAFGPGGEGFVRMCYASSMDNLTEALARLKRFIGRL